MNQVLQPIALPLVKPGQAGYLLEIGEGETQITRSILPGGVRVLTQEVPGALSVAVGALLPVGSTDEVDGHFGSTHFLEHLLFKGTKTRSALDIARIFDVIGGESNAATAKEYTSYYARVLGSDLPIATRTLLDMVTSSVLDNQAFELERTVILDELAMAADDPSSVVHESFLQQLFPGHPLGRPVGGSPETVGKTPREAVWEHYQQHYRSPNLVISAAGKVRHDQLCEIVLDALAEGGWDTHSITPPAPLKTTPPLPALQADRRQLTRPGEQAHLLMGTRSLPAGNPENAVMATLLTILGGGMSSRLFQEVREKRGLAYTTYAFDASYRGSGSFGVYAGCAPQNLAEVEKVALAQWEDLAAGNVTPAELEQAKGQLRGSVALGMEDNLSRMSRLGRSEVVLGKINTMESFSHQLSAVTAKQVSELAQKLLESPLVCATVVPEGN